MPLEMRLGRRHLFRQILLSLLVVGIPLSAWGGEGGASRLRERYQELRDLGQRGPFGLPLSVRSVEQGDRVTAEVDGIIDHPFEEIKAALGTPASWCEFAPLHLNVKACTFQADAPDMLLTLYVGRKYYQSPEDASSQTYRFTVQTGEPGFLSVTLTASEGLFGTTSHRFRLEAAGVDGRTVVALRLSYVPSVVTRMLTAIYLATVGRNRVGFTQEDVGPPTSPEYVKGFRGLVERNVMRYYLAFDAYLDTRSVPLGQRFEACINAAYDMMERYPVQLHDMEKAEYLEVKRKERDNQLRLQQKLGAAGPHSKDGRGDGAVTGG